MQWGDGGRGGDGGAMTAAIPAEMGADGGRGGDWGGGQWRPPCHPLQSPPTRDGDGQKE